MKKLVVLLFIALALSACGPANVESVSINNGLKRLVDEEAGVVCWFIHPSAGISCLPIEETKLKR